MHIVYCRNGFKKTIFVVEYLGHSFKQQLLLNITPYSINLSVINDWKMFSEFVFREIMAVSFMKSLEAVTVASLLACHSF